MSRYLFWLSYYYHVTRTESKKKSVEAPSARVFERFVGISLMASKSSLKGNDFGLSNKSCENEMKSGKNEMKSGVSHLCLLIG